MTTDHNAISRALGLLPGAFRERVKGVEFVCRRDPVAAGLHTFEFLGPAGASWSVAAGQTAHYVMPECQTHRPRAARKDLVVLPQDYAFAPEVIIHELGHVLDNRIESRRHTRIAPVTDYARWSSVEAFAEAFTAYVLPGFGDQRALYEDFQTVALFRDLRLNSERTNSRRLER